MRRPAALSLVAVIAGAVSIVAADGGLAAAPVTYLSGPCPEVVPVTPLVECGTLTVPEDREHLDRGTVRLAVAVLHPESGPDPDAPPLLFLSGGPGDRALPEVETLLEEPWVTDRDMILVDLRGTGASTPFLGCPEIDEVDDLARPSDDASTRAAYLHALKTCRKRLVDEGANLKQYDYTEITADLADLRRALGIDEWSVYGISNGGRVALELVRRHPQGIRSLVLDSALPPQGNYYGELWPHAARAFDVFFQACAEDPDCAAAYPDLEARFWELVASLREEPVSVTITSPVTGEPATVVFDDILSLTVLRGALYDTALLPILPGILDGLTQGQGFELVAEELHNRLPSGPSYSLGENLSDNCREEVAFIDVRELPRQARAMPRFRRAILHADALMRDECRVWDVGKADPSVDQPVRSNIPALLLVGAFDPVHPRASSDAIARYLSRSEVVEFPGTGHGTAFDHECPRLFLQAFVTDHKAELDTSCVDRMEPPDFA